MSLCQLANAQSFPSKPVTIVVPFTPGGGADNLARILVPRLNSLWGQSVIVEYRAGASGQIGADYVSKANPDGYTLMMATTAVINDKNVSKFVGISLVSPEAYVLVVHPSLPVKNTADLIAYAKANPTKLNYASQGNGSVSHIGTEIFKQKFGIEVVHVPYKGSGAAIADVLAGQVQLFITTPPSVMGHVQTGKLKALAVTSKKRHPMMPDVPTVAEAGVSNFELESWVALYLASDTPSAVITTLSSAVEKALSLAETKKRADLAGIELRYLPPTRMTAMLNKEIAETAIAIKAAKITLD